jgi:hypothetical protein
MALELGNSVPTLVTKVANLLIGPWSRIGVFFVRKIGTKFKEARRSLRIKKSGSCAFVFRHAISSDWRESLWILVSASPRVVILHFDRSGPIQDGEFLPHGEGKAFAELKVVILVGAWHFERVQWDVSALREFLHLYQSTYLL